MKRAVSLLAFLLAGTALAQQSASFELREHAFNAGGNAGAVAGGVPVAGVVLVSPSFRITQSALGDTVAATLSASPGFTLAATLLVANPPPGEVVHLRFADATTLVWDAEPSVGVYHVYQGTLGLPFDPGYGTCLPPEATSETATFAPTPAPGAGLFVLLTAENRLGEEGTKGFRGDGAERPNPAPCP